LDYRIIAEVVGLGLKMSYTIYGISDRKSRAEKPFIECLIVDADHFFLSLPLNFTIPIRP